MVGVQVRRGAATLIELTLVVAILVTAVLGVVRPLIGPGGLGLAGGSIFGASPSVDVTLDYRKVHVQTDPALPSLDDFDGIASGDGVELNMPTGTTATVFDADLRQFVGLVGLVGPEALTGLLTITVLVLLLLIVRTLRRGDPFIPANARRLYVVAGAVGIGGQAVVLLEAWGRAGVLTHPMVAPYVYGGTHITVVPLVVGLGIAVAAEVFRHGADLREEVAGLV